MPSGKWILPLPFLLSPALHSDGIAQVCLAQAEYCVSRAQGTKNDWPQWLWGNVSLQRLWLSGTSQQLRVGSKPNHKAPVHQPEALQQSYRSREACKTPLNYRTANPGLVEGKIIKKQNIVTEFWKGIGKMNKVLSRSYLTPYVLLFFFPRWSSCQQMCIRQEKSLWFFFLSFDLIFFLNDILLPFIYGHVGMWCLRAVMHVWKSEPSSEVRSFSPWCGPQPWRHQAWRYPLGNLTSP